MPKFWWDGTHLKPIGTNTLVVIGPPPVDPPPPPPVDPPPVPPTPTPGTDRSTLVIGDYIPDATTTGPLPGITLTDHAGDFVVTRNGQVIENLYIDGSINLGSFTNVIIRNVHGRGTATRGTDTAFVYGAGDNLRGALIEDCLFEGKGNDWVSAMRGGNYTVRRTEFTGIPDGIGLTSQLGNVTIEGCWIHNGAYNEWEVEQGSNGGGTKYYPYAVGTTLAAKSLTDVTTTAGSATITSAAAAWLNRDTNRTVRVAGAGPAGGVLTATIVTVNSATSVTLSATATASLTNASTTVDARIWGLYTHVDGVQFHRGKHYKIRGNRIGGTRVLGSHNVYPSQKAVILTGDDMYNSAFMIKQEVDNTLANRIEDVIIELNFLAGGTATINFTSGNDNPFADTYIRDNKFYRSTWGGQTYMLCGPNIGHLSNNTFLDDGTAVPVTRGF